MTEYAPAKTEGYPSDIPQFLGLRCCEKHLKDNKHSSLQLARKYPRVFVLGHYLFFKAHTFPRANLSLLGAGNVQGQISEHIFGLRVLSTEPKNFDEGLTLLVRGLNAAVLRKLCCNSV